MSEIDLQIESLIFSCDSPITANEIRSVLVELRNSKHTVSEVEEAIARLMAKYESPNFSLQIKEISGGYKFFTKGEFHETIGVFLKQTTKKKLSKSALETLSIIAYKQDITKSGLEQIRGVNCDYSVQKLLEKELVVIKGRADTPGRPLMYGTSAKFMDYFGLRSMKDLPKLKDFEDADNEIGTREVAEELVNNDKKE